MDILTLDLKGVALAFVIAFFLLLCGGFTVDSLFFVGLMVYFLLLSAAVTRVGKKFKKKAKLWEETRGIKNVMANGYGPLIYATLFALGWSYLQALQPFFLVAFAASAAAVTADKFSSEIGVLGSVPISIMTGKPVKKGVSGGVTLLGTLSGLFGAFLIALPIVAYHSFAFAEGAGLSQCSTVCFGAIAPAITIQAWLLAVTIGGFIGTLVDSVLGYYEEKGIGSKYSSNFACSIAGGLVGMLVYLLLAGL
jgi:uncharacterized protein (TIGR00297 family)